MHLIKIIDGLYTRGKLRTGTQPSELETLGIGRVISLIPPGEPSLVGWKGYSHHPMSDGATVDQGKLDRAVGVVLKAIGTGIPVLVMCRAGRNRTGLVVCTALNRRCGWNGAFCLEYFRARRPRGVANPAFERYILGLPMATTTKKPRE